MYWHRAGIVREQDEVVPRRMEQELWIRHGVYPGLMRCADEDIGPYSEQTSNHMLIVIRIGKQPGRIHIERFYGP